MFALKEHSAVLNSFNPRAENHGDEHQLAGDIGLLVRCPNTVLDEFDRSLKTMLFRKPAEGEQEELGLEDGMDGLVARKLPNLDPLGWAQTYHGYRIEISEGMGLKDPLSLKVDLSKFKITPLDGGTVEINFRASGPLTAAESGELCALIKDDVEISLFPPSAEEEAQRQIDEFKATA